MKKSLIAFALLALSTSAQANFMCSVAEKGLDIATETIATTLKCNNPEAISADLTTITKVDQYCGKDEGFVLKSLSCKLISTNAATLIADQIPTEWECDSEHSEDLIGDVIFKACDFVLGQNK